MLWDSKLHLNFFTSKLQVWKSAGHRHLRELLAMMGFPFEQCHQPWAFVGPGMRSRLRRLAPTIYDSVKLLLSMVDAVLALLDVPRKEETVPMAEGRLCQYDMRMCLPQACHMGCCAQQRQASNDGRGDQRGATSIGQYAGAFNSQGLKEKGASEGR